MFDVGADNGVGEAAGAPDDRFCDPCF